MACLLISAACKSSGKTVISLGLSAALARRGVVVQPFKKGPDYIDPMWLSMASGRSCYNLDFHVQERSEIQHTFVHAAQKADIALIEGNKGLFDGIDPKGTDSNAAIAKLLNAPVILVLDATGTIRGVAPLLLGYQAFESDLNIAGVILNKVGGLRHERKLRAAIESYTDIPVLGAVHKDPSLNIDERHLGLRPVSEIKSVHNVISTIAQAIAVQVDLDALLSIARTVPVTSLSISSSFTPHPKDLRIAVARDRAFGFYYPDDLLALEDAGAELIPLDMIQAPSLPDVDGLFIGGGFPETQLTSLAANTTLLEDIHAAIEGGLPVYAECGGLMYLSRSVTCYGETRNMVGVIPGDAVMGVKPQGRGYTYLRETGASPWSLGLGVSFPAHEFHYSRLENLGKPITYAYDVLRGYGIDGYHDGIVYKNLLASYCHLRHVRTNFWATRFVTFVRRIKNQTIGRTAFGE